MPDDLTFLMGKFPALLPGDAGRGTRERRSSMNVVAIQEALHRQPFRPFTFRLADGRTLPVPHPDFVAVSPRTVIVIHADESFSILEPLLIVSIEGAATTPTSSNGS